jgi:hypothetical protein
MVHAVGNAHKMSVVSFGLFGDQDVFRSEATGAGRSGPLWARSYRAVGGTVVPGLANVGDHH